ncbi:MAG: hypothetical protein AAB320_11205 [Elusimicrobiota bacterium]
MRWALSLLLFSGCAGRQIEQDDSLKISQSFACPLPAHQGFLQVQPDGGVSLVIFEGFEGPPKSKSTRQKKRLSEADMKDLAAIVAGSGFSAMPEHVGSYPPRREQTDPCSHTLEVSTGGKTKAVSYIDGDVPADLAGLVHRIGLVLDRYPWENGE